MAAMTAMISCKISLKIVNGNLKRRHLEVLSIKEIVIKQKSLNKAGHQDVILEHLKNRHYKVM